MKDKAYVSIINLWTAILVAFNSLIQSCLRKIFAFLSKVMLIQDSWSFSFSFTLIVLFIFYFFLEPVVSSAMSSIQLFAYFILCQNLLVHQKEKRFLLYHRCTFYTFLFICSYLNEICLPASLCSFSVLVHQSSWCCQEEIILH